MNAWRSVPQVVAVMALVMVLGGCTLVFPDLVGAGGPVALVQLNGHPVITRMCLAVSPSCESVRRVDEFRPGTMEAWEYKTEFEQAPLSFFVVGDRAACESLRQANPQIVSLHSVTVTSTECTGPAWFEKR